MKQVLINTLLFLPLFTGCIGLHTEKPLCKEEVLADINDFAGTATTFKNGLPINAKIKRLKKGTYLIHEENDPELINQRLSHPIVRFCRFGSKVVAEYQMYNPVLKKFSEKTFWPSLVRVKDKRLEFYLAGIDKYTLIEKSIPFFSSSNPNNQNLFVVINSDLDTDQKLISAIYLMEKTPNTVIDLNTRIVRSPVF